MEIAVSLQNELRNADPELKSLSRRFIQGVIPASALKKIPVLKYHSCPER
jgi:hypothetical protein